jgi:hypothetical protein
MSVLTSMWIVGRTSKVSDLLDLSDKKVMRRVAEPS